MGWLHGSLTINTFADKIGYVFNNSMFNITSSGAGTFYTGVSCAKSVTKAFITPAPWCKALYGTAAVLNGGACLTSVLCLLGGTSAVAPIPVAAGALGSALLYGGRLCTAVAACTDPTAGVTEKAVEKCVDNLLGT